MDTNGLNAACSGTGIVIAVKTFLISSAGENVLHKTLSPKSKEVYMLKKVITIAAAGLFFISGLIASGYPDVKSRTLVPVPTRTPTPGVPASPAPETSTPTPTPLPGPTNPSDPVPTPTRNPSDPSPTPTPAPTLKP